MTSFLEPVCSVFSSMYSFHLNTRCAGYRNRNTYSRHSRGSVSKGGVVRPFFCRFNDEDIAYSAIVYSSNIPNTEYHFFIFSVTSKNIVLHTTRTPCNKKRMLGNSQAGICIIYPRIQFDGFLLIITPYVARYHSVYDVSCADKSVPWIHSIVRVNDDSIVRIW